MKKLISIVLALAMVMSLITIPASAAVKSKIYSGYDISTQNGGLYGKAADEYAVKWTTPAPNADGTGGDTKMPIKVVGTGDDYDFSDSKYLVLDLNVAPFVGATSFSCGPNAGLYAISGITAFNVNQWNSVRIVVEEKTAAEMTAAVTYQPMTMYVNGVKVGEAAAPLCDQDGGARDVLLADGGDGKNAFGKGFRFSVHGAKGTDVAYVADVRLSESDENAAPVMPALSASDAYEVSGTEVIINAASPAKVSDITASTNTVRVYNKGEQITDTTAELKHGYQIVVENDANKLYTYYTVSDGRNVIVDQKSGFVTGSASFVVNGEGSWVESNDGYAGNTSAVRVDATTTGKDVRWWQFEYDADPNTSGIQHMSENTAKYLVAGYDVFVPDTATAVLIGSNQNGGLIGSIFPALVKNSWNTVTFVIKNNSTADNAALRADKTMDSGTADTKGVHTYDLYINGDKVHEDLSAKRFGMYYKNSDTDIRSNYMIRNVFNGDINDTFVFDDIYMYDTDVLPADIGIVDYPAVTAANSKLSVRENQIKLVDATATAADLTGSNITVYTDDTYTTTKAADEALEIGDIVTAYDGDTVKVYTVAEPEIVIFEQTTPDSFTSKYNGTFTEATTGIAGKTDASMKVERASGLTGKQTYIELAYKHMSYDTSKYVVLEMNYMPTAADAQFYIAGQQGSSLTTGFSDKLVMNQWNKIVLVFTNGSTAENPNPGSTRYTAADPTATTTSTDSKSAAIKASPHSYEVYLNGSKVASGAAGTSAFGMFWENKAYNTTTEKISTVARQEKFFRLLFPISGNYGAYEAYLDDVILYETEVINIAELSAMPAIPAIDGLMFAGTRAFGEGVAVADVLAKSGTTVFTDAACSTVKTEGNLELGNVIAYTDGTDVSYYTLTEATDIDFYEKKVYDSSVDIFNGTAESVEGADGAGDTAFKLYAKSEKGDQSNVFIQPASYSAATFGQRPYYVMVADVKFEENAKSFHFGTNGHAHISHTIVPSHENVKDGWNRIAVVVNNFTGESITYINGIKSGNPLVSNLYNGKTNTDIRLIANAIEESTEKPVICLDNIHIYLSANPELFVSAETDDSVTFTATDIVPDDAVVLAAAFDGSGNMLGNVAIGTESATITKVPGATKYVGYLWNNTTDIRPLAEEITIN